MKIFHHPALKRTALLPLALMLSSIALVACNGESVPASAPAVAGETPDRTLILDSAESTLTADLTNDALIPPTEPTLDISATPGKLLLSWSMRSNTQRVSVYRYDTSTGAEQKLDIALDPVSTSLTLPSQTHRSAWHRTQYRVELCDSDDCVSSQRVAIIGLADQTVTHVRPGVFIKGEPYAQDIASNDDGAVFAVSRPLEGAVDIHIKSEDQWVLAQHLRLNNLNLSATRQLQLALSANGDVIAVMISDITTHENHQIRILERLGEAWFELQQLPITTSDSSDSSSGSSTDPSSGSPQAALPSDSFKNGKALQLSSDGDRLLIRLDNSVSLITRGTTGWARTALGGDFQFDGPLVSASGSASLDRIFTLHENEQQLWLIRWQESAEAGQTSKWISGSPLLISSVSTSFDTQIMSDDQGNTIAIAGWEDSASAQRTPVMWRYLINTIGTTTAGSGESPTHSLNVIDSLRLAPTTHTQASLRFSSDRNLSNLAFGWQLEPHSTEDIMEDAQLITYSYDTTSHQWLTALEIPEAIPTLAKRSFANKVVMSANGSTLFLGTSGIAQGLSTNGAEVLILH